MNEKAQRLRERYASCPASAREYTVGGKKFCVTRHFIGGRELKKEIYGLARARADRESGLS